MPIRKDTPAQREDLTHKWIDGFTVNGMIANEIQLEILHIDCYLDQHNNPVPVQSGRHPIIGESARQFIQDNYALYVSVAQALYQKLIDDGIEVGDIMASMFGAGSSSSIFSGTATLSIDINLSGSSAMVFSGTATLTADLNLSGSMAMVFSGSATLSL